MEQKKHNIALDKRVVNRFIAKEKISKADYESHLKSLPDMAAECDDINDMIFKEKPKKD